MVKVWLELFFLKSFASGKKTFQSKRPELAGNVRQQTSGDVLKCQRLSWATFEPLWNFLCHSWSERDANLEFASKRGHDAENRERHGLITPTSMVLKFESKQHGLFYVSITKEFYENKQQAFLVFTFFMWMLRSCVFHTRDSKMCINRSCEWELRTRNHLRHPAACGENKHRSREGAQLCLNTPFPSLHRTFCLPPSVPLYLLIKIVESCKPSFCGQVTGVISFLQRKLHLELKFFFHLSDEKVLVNKWASQNNQGRYCRAA